MSAQLYAGLGAVVVIALLMFGIKIQMSQITHLQRTNAELNNSVTTLKQANAAQHTTIAVFQSANEAWAKWGERQTAAYMGALADLTRANVARNDLDAKLRVRENADKVSVACKQVLDIDLGVACEGIETAIKERAK